MNDELSPEAKALLSLAKDHDELGPSTGDRERVKRALQIAIAAGATSATASAAAASTVTGTGTGMVASSSAVFLKGLAVLTAVGGLVTATVVSVASEEPSAVEAAEVERRHTAQDDLSDFMETAAEELEEAPDEPVEGLDETADTNVEGETDPELEAPPPTPSHPTPRARVLRRETREPEPEGEGVSTEPAIDPRRDVTLLREALSHLRRGAHSRARSALEEHARAYPTSALSTEREGLSALLACESQEDTHAAEAFLARHPGSALRAQLRRACSLDE